jgi:hypothetical protein
VKTLIVALVLTLAGCCSQPTSWYPDMTQSHLTPEQKYAVIQSINQGWAEERQAEAQRNADFATVQAAALGGRPW